MAAAISTESVSQMGTDAGSQVGAPDYSGH